MSYHAFLSEDGTRYGSFEVFYMTEENIAEFNWVDDDGGARDPGWYWWACFPGCMPDGEPSGPYQSEAEAIDDANSR
jgi:hypothetical protein